MAVFSRQHVLELPVPVPRHLRRCCNLLPAWVGILPVPARWSWFRCLVPPAPVRQLRNCRPPPRRISRAHVSSRPPWRLYCGGDVGFTDPHWCSRARFIAQEKLGGRSLVNRGVFFQSIKCCWHHHCATAVSVTADVSKERRRLWVSANSCVIDPKSTSVARDHTTPSSGVFGNQRLRCQRMVGDWHP